MHSTRPRAIRFLAVWAALAAGAWAAEAEIEFSGVLGDGSAGGTKFMLATKAAGQSRWLKVGEEFAGYTVTAYEPKDETIVLTKAGQTVRMKLKDSKIKSVPVEPPPAVQRAILNNMRQLAAAADQFYLENGVSTTTYDQLVGPTKYVKQILVQDGENYRAIVFKQGTAMEVTTSGGFKTRYAP
jgi:hypothetical protein